MNLLIIGAQGCGIGTQAELLAKQFGLFRIETGQILRDLAKQDTELGRMIKAINDRKDMAPDDLMLEILKQELKEVPLDKGIIFDGIPRTENQIGPFEQMLENFGRTVDRVVFLKISREESVKRVSRRFHCEDCKIPLILGSDFKDPSEKCPNCQGVIVQRGDDTPDGIEKRLNAFAEKTLPVIEYYRKKEKLIEIDGEQEMQDVFQEIIKKIA